ncbi:hypothetical protein GALMADRAFT_218951 [Galerina marginata CBS 339.88]|uniref:Uncharacterized protein n=1 Tax=Galerina marginata (strain CBS 339.88) TaxID=685588 RepID=A0A067TU69_GALM3|nr:hypothetical protein GALMADRAFT_218951 [Galerina marginata CBS 339.88]
MRADSPFFIIIVMDHHKTVPVAPGIIVGQPPLSSRPMSLILLVSLTIPDNPGNAVG